jgi:hypothetical protein
LPEKPKNLPLIAFLIVVSTLLFLDYRQVKSGPDSFFLTSILQGIFRPTTISQGLFVNTSLEGQEINTLSSLETFFDPFLTLPESMSARRFGIEGTSIVISELQTQSPAKVVQLLLQQEKPEYQFNKINTGTFYLNQLPLEKKTHNFLGIVIKNTLYGFQYLPQEHQKVLEIIDALQQNE